MQSYILFLYVHTTIFKFVLCRGICSSSGDNELCSRLECFFTPFAKAYIEICQEQIKTGKEFFGLRDFYR